jgi:lipopolysaccharide/colanic/teichoic acid biosynthesis glycosyltransferase
LRDGEQYLVELHKIKSKIEFLNRSVSQEELRILSEWLPSNLSGVRLLDTTNGFNIDNLEEPLDGILNLGKVNNIRFINRFFIQVNEKLENGQFYIGRFESIKNRYLKKSRKLNPFHLALVFLFDFLFLRISPKIWGLKKIYFLVTRGRNRLLSEGEVLGRLVSCGFEISKVANINGVHYFIVTKVSEPIVGENPSYGPLIKLNRLGKNGKTIKVYKFRTMHPYAEYLHDYILKQNGYAETGKPADDFRLTFYGPFLRRYWLDELPQLINVLKGEMRLLGVRPVSARYFQDIPEELQKLRLKHKPGCIPPYVALNRKGSKEDVLLAEKEYLEMKERSPFWTDIKLFFKSIYNIVFRNKRSA